VKNSDRIIVLKDGQIAEAGNHDELLAAGGLYTELYERQLLSQELEAL
jgi:ATP-binding cassette subfamily B protein